MTTATARVAEAPLLPFLEPAPGSWQEWVRDNRHVWLMFERFSLEAWTSGCKRIGAKAVFERMRWELRLRSQHDGWALNNSRTAELARHFLRLHPECGPLFETRERRSDA